MADRKLSKEIWVNEFTEKSAQEFREQMLHRSDKDEGSIIQVNIDSYGGYVDSLAKMIETMDEVPNPIMTHVSGKAMSCGAILLSHGDIRFCGARSRVMVHNVLSAAWGDLKEMEEGVEETKRLNKIFLGLLAKNCNISYTELQKRIKATTSSRDIYMGPQEALDFGIIDHIGTPSVQDHSYSQVVTIPSKVRGAAFEPPKPSKKRAKKKKKK